MRQTLKIITLSALGTAALIKGVPALAAPAQDGTAATIVRTADLDLDTSDGRRVLDHRLARAAADVCGTPSAANLRGANEARRCRSDVLAQARAQSSRILASRSSKAGILVAAR